MRAHKPKCDVFIETRLFGGGGSIYKKFMKIHAFLRPNEIQWTLHTTHSTRFGQSTDFSELLGANAILARIRI